MSVWLREVIGNDLIAVYEGLYFTEDAVLWLREKPRTFGELRAKEIDWLRWMAANVRDKAILEKLSEDPDTDVRMWVACNPMTPEPVLGKLGGVLRRLAEAATANTPISVPSSTPSNVLIKRDETMAA